MKKIVIKNIADNKFEKSVACIGYFDGVHIGHKKLLNRAIKDAHKFGVKSSLICFEPDPINVITGKINKHLYSFKNRLTIFEECGIDIVYVIKFDDDFMKLSAINFIRKYLNIMNLVELVCGYDYSFGYKAKGNAELLKDKGKFNTVIIKETKFLGEKVSSTRIKESLLRGNFKLVNKLLGYNYLIDLKVVNCEKEAKNWLIKAKLSDPNCLLPLCANFDGIIEIKHNRVYILGKNKLKNNSHLYLEFNE